MNSRTIPRTVPVFLRDFALVAACAVAIAAASTAAEPRAAEAFGLQSYIAELNWWSGIVGQLDQHAPELGRLRASLPAQWVVQVGNQEFRVPTTWLGEMLDDAGKEPGKAGAIGKEMLKRLAAMREQAEALAGPGMTPQGDAARAELERIFTRREFQAMRGPSWWELLRQRVTVWLAEQITRLLGKLHLRANIGDLLAWVIIAAAFLALLFWAKRTLARSRRGVVLEIGKVARQRDSCAWVREAIETAGRREYREAIHCAYWAAIVWLQDTGKLPREASRTPRESLRLLSANDANHVSLATLTRALERIWYGFAIATSADWEEAVAQLEKMGCLVR